MKLMQLFETMWRKQLSVQRRERRRQQAKGSGLRQLVVRKRKRRDAGQTWICSSPRPAGAIE